MPQRLLLLTGSFEAGMLVPHLARHNPDCALHHVESFQALESALADAGPSTRLLAFCTAVIVPINLLDRLPGPSYNIHPGPPNFPGRHPESWGAYHRVRSFGATLHEMAPRVDEGAIIDVARFDPPEGGGQLDFGMGAFRAALELVLRWSKWLTGDDRPLPRSDLQWSGHKTTHAELVAMCHVTPDLDFEEFERRRRAFAEPAGSRMTVRLHGRDFHYTAPESERTETGKPKP
jgi:methionyl-tRNA formyltransferase